MKVLVTGGTGYVGRTIVHALARQGHTPVVFARAASRSGLPGRLVDGDMRDRAAVNRAAEGVDAICHTAALVSIWRARREEFDEVNLGGFQNVIDVCQTLGLARLVYTSSFLALPPAGATAPLAANDYQRTKVAALEIARAASARGVPIISMCPGVIYGPGHGHRGQPGRPARPRSSRGTAAGHHRRRPSVVVRLCRRRCSGARRGADAW